MSSPDRRLHERALELAATRLDFELAAGETAELEAHLGGCPTCAHSAAAFRTDAAAIRLFAALPSRRVDRTVHAAIAGHPVRSSSRMLVLVAAAALLIVALLGVAAAGAFLLRAWPPVAIVPSPSAPAVVVVSPAPNGPPVWELTTIPPMFAGGSSTPVGASAGGSGFVAVGGRAFRDANAPSGGVASAWRSADGQTWEAAVAGADLAVGDIITMSGPVAGLADVAWGPAGYVAVGTALETTGAVGGAWFSTDGLSWTRSELPTATLARPASITWNGSRYVAVGVIEAQDAPRAAAWLSSDGRSWSRARDGVYFDIGSYIDTGEYHGWAGPTDVASSPDGIVYAVGRTCTATPGTGGQPACRTLVWRSPDGEAWALDYQGDVSPKGVLSSVAASGTRVVAAGASQGSATDAAQVAIDDGAGWRLTQPAGVPRLERIVAFRDGFLGLATAGEQLSLWTSSDGQAFAPVSGVPQPPDVTVLRDVDLVVAGKQAVIVGWAELSSAAGIGGFAIVWSPTDGPVPAPTSPAQPTPGPGASASPIAPTPSPLSVGSWEAIPEVPALDGAVVSAVTPVTGGLVAVGRVSGGNGQDPQPAAWWSTDGRAWSHISSIPTAAPGATLSAVATSGSGFMIVGGDLVWTTADRGTWAQSSLGAGSHAWGVASRGSLLVVVGSVDNGTTTPPAQKPAIWTSADGLAWSRSTPIGPGAAYGSFGSVIAGGTGFVAYGTASAATPCDVCGAITPDHRLDGAPWFSADGQTWTRVANPEPFALSRIDGIVYGGPGLVAVGQRWTTTTTGTSVVWTSVDGRSWTEVTVAPPFSGSVDIGLGGGGSRLIAFDRSAHDVANPLRWWSSRDGATWEAVSGPSLFDSPGVSIAAIVSFESGLVAVGSREVPSTPGACPATKVSPADACRTVGTVWVSPQGPQ